MYTTFTFVFKQSSSVKIQPVLSVDLYVSKISHVLASIIGQWWFPWVEGGKEVHKWKSKKNFFGMLV